jgi:hypothetical protein
MRTQSILIDCLNELENSLETNNTAISKQQAFDRADKTFNNFFHGLGKRILGVARAGKRNIEYEPLFSYELERLYEEQELSPTVERAYRIADKLCQLSSLKNFQKHS